MTLLPASRRDRYRFRLFSASPPLFRLMSPLLVMARLLVLRRSARLPAPMAPVLASRAV
ncbi:hypothetical protein HGQ98_26865 [Achromobacter ruhlandii]|uniref:Uncharacterized protein n=1 Tax=Achromobacter ruhlandii TaxID=72557 RepID=A0A848NUC5_9BURK|nr:hypothetical protein [Achromobacter ruhlandii]NMU93125.1 hypothetical protein [Achromobacter ruhlandii]